MTKPLNTDPRLQSQDPAERQAAIREHFAAERAKLPRVDHNGRPIPPEADAGE